MSSLTISLIVFGVVFGGALLGMLLRAWLPEHHQHAAVATTHASEQPVEHVTLSMPANQSLSNARHHPDN